MHLTSVHSQLGTELGLRPGSRNPILRAPHTPEGPLLPGLTGRPAAAASDLTVGQAVLGDPRAQAQASQLGISLGTEERQQTVTALEGRWYILSVGSRINCLSYFQIEIPAFLPCTLLGAVGICISASTLVIPRQGL